MGLVNLIIYSASLHAPLRFGKFENLKMCWYITLRLMLRLLLRAPHCFALRSCVSLRKMCWFITLRLLPLVRYLSDVRCMLRFAHVYLFG